ncbi:breast cancer type 1 susceptibility protein [Mastomys coucha]|uniref:breast cancer type 1 susceptibility protein n=1 Tax=Mastomys coucha TaxID=35658 RepID=UPI00126153A3|nr:breast cancer type 1 susceptibility protein [Mastomys coucha]
MDLSAVRIQEVQHVLHAMGKILECPICLELIKEPVSTKCDHIFCKFCMLKLLNQKKGPSQCPLCKNEITKRSLQGSTRFSQLVEELLKIIDAFELDTGMQFAKGFNFSKQKNNFSEHLNEEASVIQSVGYRNRVERLRRIESGNATLKDSLSVQLSNLGIVRSVKKNRQTQPRNKSVYIELESDSSEETINNPDDCSVKDHKLLQIAPTGAGDEGKLHSAKEAACEFSEGIRNIEHQCSDKDLNPTENHATKRHPEKRQSISVSNVHVEPCGTDAHASSLQPETSSLLLTEDRMDAEKAEFCNKSKQSGIAVSQQSRWAESKETCNERRVPSTGEKVDANADSLCGGKKWAHPKSLCPENSGATTDVPWITLNSSIKKVNEWFSRTGEMLTSDGASDRDESNAKAAVVLEVSNEVDECFSSSKKIDLAAPDSLNALMCKSGRDLSKPVENNTNDKIFGKTYQRKGSRPPLNHVTEIIGTFTKEPQITQEQPFTNKLKRKRSTCLQPEDFIKKADLAVVQRTPENMNQGTNQMEPNDQAMSITSDYQENKITGNNLQEEKNAYPIESLKKEPAFTAKAKSLSNSISDLEVELNVHSSKAPKKNRLKRKSSTRCVLPLEPISRNPSLPTCAELQIDSCGSSEEKKNNSNQTPARHSREPQLIKDTEPAADAKKYEPNEHKKKRSASDALPEEKLMNKAGLLTSCSSPRKPQGPVNPSPQRKGIEQLETCQVPDNTKELRDLVLGGEPSGKPTEQSEESTSVSLVPDTDYDTQNSVSVLEASTVRYTRTESAQCMTQFVASVNPKELVHGSNNAGSGTECFKHPLRHELNHSQETTEMEDSELDTQYLQNTFQVSKRQSFALFSKPRSPQKDCAHSVPSREPSPKLTSKGTEKEHQEQEESEISHVQVVTATVGLPVPCQEGKPDADIPCAGVSGLCPSSHYRSSENGLSTTGKAGISQNSHFKQSVSPIRSSIKTDNRKLLTEERFEKHTSSTEKAMGNETIVQSTVHTISQNNRNNACREASLDSIDEVCSTGEYFRGQLGRNRGPKVNTMLPFDSTQPGVCKQSVSASDKYLEIKKQEGETVGADFSPCLFSDHLEQPMRSGKIFQVCSETPDDLLDDVEIRESTSFGEGDIMERSAVFNGSVLRRESSRSPSPVTHALMSRSLHKGSRKLESSEESDSSEDEDLPCFQHLLSRTSKTPELTRCSNVVTQRMSEKAEGTQAPWKGSISDCNNEVILIEEHQFSEDPKCSGSMFSSQYSAAQGSPANANSQDANFNPHSKQRSRQSENEEAFLSDKELISDNEEMAACVEEDNDQEDSIIPDSEASGYASETNLSEDCSQSDILTTQQRATMKDNLIKLQQEMAHLEAVLEQHGNQPSGHSPSLLPDPCALEDLPDLEQNMSGTAILTSKNINENHVSQNLKSACDAKFRPQHPDGPTSRDKESGMGRPHAATRQASGCKKPQDPAPGVGEAQSEVPAELLGAGSEAKTGRFSILGTTDHRRAENSVGPQAGLLAEVEFVFLAEGTPYLESGISLFSSRDPKSDSPREPARVCTTPGSTSALKILHGQVAESLWSPAAASADAAVVGTVTSSKERAAREISMVVSGLTPKEIMIVQKFAEKYRLTLTDTVTEETTHVIIKTDAEFVCERTLKYFLGIAGGKWIVSYKWVIQSIQERKLLNVHEFEVKGDVVTGRNHHGPKRSRESQEKLFKGLQVYCCEPFTNMPKDVLERLLQLCGASVVKELPLLTPDTSVHPVVIVQPSAWTEDSDYPDIGQLCKARLVMWDWVLDSISVYRCQDLGAYLVQNITCGPDSCRPQDSND